jgi:hypothetical protein
VTSGAGRSPGRLGATADAGPGPATAGTLATERIRAAGLLLPRYGEAALSDVMPSVLSALGVPDEAGVLDLAPRERVCVLLMDGLGWDLLRAHRSYAPRLNAIADDAAVLTAGFPTTTTTSLTSLGVGLPAGRHGMTGYQVRVPGTLRLLNALQWDKRTHPHEWQPCRTALQRAESAGVTVTSVAPAEFAGSGLTERPCGAGPTSAPTAPPPEPPRWVSRCGARPRT